MVARPGTRVETTAAAAPSPQSTAADEHTGQGGDYGHKSMLKKKKQKKYHVTKVTLLVTPRTPVLTQIRMKVLVDEEQQLDRNLMTAIWQRIAREALLSDPPPEKTASARRN